MRESYRTGQMSVSQTCGHPSFITILFWLQFQGGLKAVIWTDVFQGLVISVGMISVFITGTIEVGGFSKVWEINERMNRTQIFK